MNGEGLAAADEVEEEDEMVIVEETTGANRRIAGAKPCDSLSDSMMKRRTKTGRTFAEENWVGMQILGKGRRR